MKTFLFLLGVGFTVIAFFYTRGWDSTIFAWLVSGAFSLLVLGIDDARIERREFSWNELFMTMWFNWGVSILLVIFGTVALGVVYFGRLREEGTGKVNW